MKHDSLVCAMSARRPLSQHQVPQVGPGGGLGVQVEEVPGEAPEEGVGLDPLHGVLPGEAGEGGPEREGAEAEVEVGVGVGRSGEAGGPAHQEQVDRRPVPGGEEAAEGGLDRAPGLGEPVGVVQDQHPRPAAARHVGAEAPYEVRPGGGVPPAPALLGGLLVQEVAEGAAQGDPDVRVREGRAGQAEVGDPLHRADGEGRLADPRRSGELDHHRLRVVEQRAERAQLPPTSEEFQALSAPSGKNDDLA